jgi:hypothetical protein
MEERQISGIRDIRDMSRGSGALMTIQLRRGADAESILTVIRDHLGDGDT